VSPVNPLRAGLPHAFCTPDLHYIPATLQAQAAASIKGTMFKVYSQKHIDDLQQEHQNAMEFGTAAAEEWVKGLPLLGKQQMADAARLERWEASLPLGSDIPQVLREYFRPYSVSVIGETPVAVAPATISTAATTAMSATSLPAPPSAQSKFAPAGVLLFLLSLLSHLHRLCLLFSLSISFRSTSFLFSPILSPRQPTFAKESFDHSTLWQILIEVTQ
jgi:hypothetical protein